nr:immunoglobulin light chain junction region [Macaca mulatta]
DYYCGSYRIGGSFVF